MHRVTTGSNPVASTKFFLSYSPEDLGFDFPEIKKIHIDHCLDGSPLPLFDKAHAHMDDLLGHICIHSQFLYDQYGNPDDTMWHEYAHVVADSGHTTQWALILYRFGKEYLAESYGIKIHKPQGIWGPSITFTSLYSANLYEYER